jgi:hypothetical protein
MTYTFKLSRRLALANLIGASALTLLAGCAGDAPVGITPDAPGGSLSDVVITPPRATAEPNQTVKLTAFGLDAGGDSLALSDLVWTASGGTVTAQGAFSASAPGTYTLTAASRGRKKSSTVVVVPPSPSMTAVVISPDTARLQAHGQQLFTAVGRLGDGTTSAVAVTWTASGGVIDAGGTYTAGATAGTFSVIATNATTGLADTAVVKIAASATPTVQSIALTPGSVSLQTGAAQQFAVAAHLSDGSTTTASATYTATGGTITSNGLYTAGTTAGTFRVVATQAGGTLADTSVVTLAAPSTAPSPGGLYPNQPAGMTALTERGFAAIGEDGWGTSTVGRMSIVSDASAPQSAPSVAQALYPAGFNGGYEPIVVTKTLSGQHEEIYVSFWMKLSPNFVGHPSSGVNKILHLWINGINRVCLSAQGTNSNPLEPQVRLQQLNGADQFVNLRPNVNTTFRMNRNTWYHWELRMRSNTDGGANGLVEWWVNGSKMGSYSNVNFVAAGAPRYWQQVQWAPTWGGMGDTVPADQWMQMDHIFASGN